MKWVAVAAVVLAVAWWFARSGEVGAEAGSVAVAGPEGAVALAEADALPAARSVSVSGNLKDGTLKVQSATLNVVGNVDENGEANVDSSSPVRDYIVEDGVAVIDGDIVIGLPGSSGRAAQLPKITPWPTREIPVFIQPSVVLPQRIAEALTFFDQSAVRFVPYTNQRDVLVFETGTRGCKSYMGKIGGKQPIFIASNCGPHEIAHELMHALGFIHEQNRSDRDSFVRVNRDNVVPTALMNFEKFPGDYMALSGLSAFDFSSIMLYPPSMFSRNGDPTITSATGASIDPSFRLSPADVARVDSYYGGR